jgi:hypothetical protein
MGGCGEGREGSIRSEAGLVEPRELFEFGRFVQMFVHGAVGLYLGRLLLLQIVGAVRIDFDFSFPVFGP